MSSSRYSLQGARQASSTLEGFHPPMVPLRTREATSSPNIPGEHGFDTRKVVNVDEYSGRCLPFSGPCCIQYRKLLLVVAMNRVGTTPPSSRSTETLT